MGFNSGFKGLTERTRRAQALVKRQNYSNIQGTVARENCSHIQGTVAFSISVSSENK